MTAWSVIMFRLNLSMFERFSCPIFSIMLIIAGFVTMCYQVKIGLEVIGGGSIVCTDKSYEDAQPKN